MYCCCAVIYSRYKEHLLGYEPVTKSEAWENAAAAEFIRLYLDESGEEQS